MQLHKIFFRKLIIGLVLVVIAAAVSLFIKDALDTKEPTSALPILTVRCNGAPISTDSVYMAEYQWNFWTSVERMVSTYSPSNVRDQIIATNVLPNLPISIEYSRDAISTTVSRAVSVDSADFMIVEPDQNGNIYTPPIPGNYIYKVEASFDRGSVIYYFAISVTEMY